MKKVILSIMVFGMGSAFACAQHSEEIAACVKKGGTQTECEKSVHQAAEKSQTKVKAPGSNTTAN